METMRDTTENVEVAENAEYFGNERLNEISGRIIGAAIAVYRALGPGLLESAYEMCLAYELSEQGVRLERQKALPLLYGNVRLDCGYRLDMLVEDQVVVEVKAVDRLMPIHDAQILSYLRLSGRPLGLIINFNVRTLKNGVRRFVNSSHLPVMSRGEE